MMKNSLIWALSALLLPLVVVAQDGFDFSFEDGGAATGGVDAVAEPDVLGELLEAEVSEEDFAFGFEDPGKKPPPTPAPVSIPTPAPALPKPEPVPDLSLEAELGLPSVDQPDASAPLPDSQVSGISPQPSHRAVGADEYDKLLADNLELRKQIEEKEMLQEAAARENKKLASEVRDLESRIIESANVIQQLQKDKQASVGNPQKIQALEASLTRAEEEKARLSQQMEELEESIAALPAAIPVKVEPVEVAKPAPAPAIPRGAPAPPPGSDLFKQLEKEKSFLENKVVELDAERQQAESDREKILADSKKARGKIETLENETKALRAQLDEARQEQKARDKLIQQLPDLESKVAELERRAQEQKLLLSARERELRETRSELDLREERLQKAMMMQKMISEAEEKIKERNDDKLLDMHYNMAVVYAEKGQYKAAEQEFLRALRIDPTDADIHYNLGVLYDDELRNDGKALMHYRRYLKLRPYARDLDIVRGYIQRIEMK